MIAEIMVGVVFAGAGYAVLTPIRDDVAGPARIWLSVPTGAALYLFAALVMIVTTGTLVPQIALGIALALGGAGVVLAARRHLLSSSDLTWLAWAVGIAVVTVLLARLVHLTRLTPDSMRYLLGASDLVRPDALDEFNRADLVNRQIGLPALHALAEIVGRRYVASMAPLFGVSGLGLFTWLCWDLSRGLEIRRRRWLVAAAVVFLVSSNRLLYDAFYVNTHIQVAVYLLIAVPGLWLAVAKGQTGWALPAGIALASTLLFRPEAPIVAAIVLIAVAASRADWAVRLAVVVPPVVVVAIWYGVVLWNHSNNGDEISLTAPVFGSLVAVIVTALLCLVGRLEWALPVTRHLDWLMLAGLAFLLVGFGAVRPDIVVDSVAATFHNLTRDGMWMLTWVAALPLLVVALMVHRVPRARLWTVPIIGFGLLWWLLPLIRGGPWRVGTGDSGNRILAHILPVVVVFLVLAAVEPSSDREVGARGEIGMT